jgi:hypothetical protein
MEELLKKTQNALLLRDSLGRAKPPSYQLPPEDYTYGKKGGADEEGVRESK